MAVAFPGPPEKEIFTNTLRETALKDNKGRPGIEVRKP
jgi:hypothetical protein